MQDIQGITPGALWNFAAVAVALLGVAVIVFKVVEFIQGQQDRKARREREDRSADTGTLVSEIGEAVEKELAPRFEKIERDISEVNRKLENDKNRLDGHERTLNSISASQRENAEGFAALAGALLAVLDHEMHNGNDDQMTTARNELNRFLVHRGVSKRNDFET